MTIYSRGLLIGRFQPFHKGHLYLLQHVQKKVKKLAIAIGSANVFDEDNPFTYEDRKRMIEKVIHEEKLDSFIEKIVPLNDFYDDELWFKNSLHKTGNIDIIVGNNEWPNRIFEKQGYTIWRVGFFKKYLYEGEKIRELIRQKKQWFDRVPHYLVLPIQSLLTKQKNIPYRFQHIALGGTFDHFHKGHEALIDTALKYGNHISIGITTSGMYKDKNFLSAVESFNERKKSVIEYLKKKRSLQRVTIFSLSDIYGSTKNDGTIEALVVSKSTYANAIKINRSRAEKKLPELKIICIKDVKGDDGKLISSERIRRGEINREGYNFQKKQLILPEYLRKELRKPLGKVIRGKENELEKTARKVIQSIEKSKQTMVIAVGDIIVNSLERVGFIPDVKIIDYRSRRKEIRKPSRLEKAFLNKPGTISKESVDAIKKAIEFGYPKGGQPPSFATHSPEASRVKKASEGKQTVVINGEEDLLALPAILFAPLNSMVLYGQIDLGVIIVEVTEEKKKEIKKLLKKFRLS